MRHIWIKALGDERYCLTCGVFESQNRAEFCPPSQMEQLQSQLTLANQKIEKLKKAAERVLSIEKKKAQMRKDYPAGTCNAEDAWKEFGKWEQESWELLRLAASTLEEIKKV